uniref:C-type lectin domain-containing protein n=1 Tax=Globodera rostochiensis TaxID=31243 RepID=A0A914HP87_GLORO
MVNILILGIIVLFCLVSIVSAQISLPAGVPMPPGAPGSNAVESPAAVAPAGPPAGPPGGGTGRVHMPSAGHSRARPSASPVDLGNPSVSVCSGFGWTIYSGNCYKVVEGLMDWNHALAACKAEDPHAALVSIESEAENRFIGRMIARSIARSLQTYHLATTLFNTFWYCNN